MKRLILAAVFFSTFFCGLSQAETILTSPDDNGKKPQTANIYFTAAVNDKSIAELGDALNQITIRHPLVKNINLVINSDGGNVFAGLSAYTMVKSSPVPITAINAGLTASAATFLYCAAPQRQSVAGSLFLLHAASISAHGGKPDEVRRSLATLDHVHKFSKDIYRECTTLSGVEIEEIFKTEYLSKYLNDEDALNVKLSGTTVKTIPRPDVSFFILSDGSGD